MALSGFEGICTRTGKLLKHCECLEEVGEMPGQSLEVVGNFKSYKFSDRTRVVCMITLYYCEQGVEFEVLTWSAIMIKGAGTSTCQPT